MYSQHILNLESVLHGTFLAEIFLSIPVLYPLVDYKIMGDPVFSFLRMVADFYVFDFLLPVIATSYHAEAREFFSMNYQRNVDPLVFGLIKGLPFVFENIWFRNFFFVLIP